jgi:hypothetical protein
MRRVNQQGIRMILHPIRQRYRCPRQQRGGDKMIYIPSPMALIVVPSPYSYLTSMEQLVRAMAAGLTSNIALRPERVVTL